MNFQGRTRWLAGLVAVAGCFAVLVAGIGRVEAALNRSGLPTLRRMLGPDITVDGTLEAHVFPRPRLVLTAVHVRGPGVDIDIPSLEVTESLGSLLTGEMTFNQLRVSDPTATVDADALSGRLRGLGATLLGRPMPGRIAVTGAVVALRSRHQAARGLLTGFNAVVEGLNHNGSLTVGGHGTWRGQRLDVSAHLEPFFDFMAGRDTSGTVKLHTPDLTVSVEGRLHDGVRGGFEGDVVAATTSLAAVLAQNGLPAGLGQVVERASFSGSGLANPDNITFSNAHVTLDGTPFEGSLAWQPNEDHGAWTGTFATDTLDLTRAFALLPNARSPQGPDGTARWSDVPWRFDRSILGDLDLRVSSNQARIGPVVVEDAAFSAQCRDNRIEASLSEAHSGDGMIRGRAVATLEPGAVGLKIDVSLTQMDLQPLLEAVGQPRVTGTASGHLMAEARGGSPKSMLESLSGHGQISVRQGAIPGLASVAGPTSAGLVASLFRRQPAASAFDLATADVEVAGDRVTIRNGRIVGPGVRTDFAVDASLLQRSFSMGADGGAALKVAGTWDPVLRVTRTTMAPAPAGRAMPQ